MRFLKQVCCNEWFPLIPALLLACLTYCIMSGKQTIPVEFQFTNSVPESKFGSFYVFAPEYSLSSWHRGLCWRQGVYQVLCATPNEERTIFRTRIPRNAQAINFSANLPHSEQILQEIRIGSKVYKETELSFYNISGDAKFQRYSKELGGVKIASGNTIAQPGMQLKDIEKYAPFPWKAFVSAIFIAIVTFVFGWFIPAGRKFLPFLIKYRRFIINSLLFIGVFNVILLLITMLTPETSVTIKMKQPGEYKIDISSQYCAIFKPIYSNLGRASLRQDSPTVLTANVLPITQTLEIHNVNWKNVEQLQIGSKIFSTDDCKSIISANTNNICVYHFEEELKQWRVRTAWIFILGNFAFIIGTVGIFLLLYRLLKMIPAQPGKSDVLLPPHHLPISVCHFFFTAIVLALLIFVFYRLNVLQIHQTLSSAIVGDEILYCAVAAEKQAGVPDSESVSPYARLYLYSPAIQYVQAWTNCRLGNNPEFYKIETWLYRNLQLIALIAFVFFFVNVPKLQKFFWALAILLLHHCMPVVAPYSNYSGLGIAVMYFTLSAYMLFWRDDSYCMIFFAGLMSGLAYLGRISIIQFPVLMVVLYFYIKSNISRQYALTLKKVILFLFGFLLMWGMLEIVEICMFGFDKYLYEWKIQCRNQLLGGHGIAVGAWSCDWLWSNITNHWQDMIKRYGMFVYIYCVLLIYSLLQCMTFESKKTAHYLPHTAILVGFAQVAIFLCVQKGSHYVTVAYLLSLMGLSAVFLYPKSKNPAYALTILFCCFLWTAPNLSQLRSLDEMKEPSQPLQLYTVNYALCSLKYPNTPLLLYKNPACSHDYSQIRLSEPHLKVVVKAEEVVDFVKSQEALVCLHNSKIPFLKTCEGVNFRQVEEFGNFVWFYATMNKEDK